MARWPATVAAKAARAAKAAKAWPQVMSDDEAELSAGALTDPCGPTVRRGRARIVAFERVSLGSGLIRFRDEAGITGGAWAERERWGKHWPPRQGDVIDVIARVTVVLRERRA